MKDDELLKRILEFLNKVPNNKYGDNYKLASELTERIIKIEERNKFFDKLMTLVEQEINNNLKIE